MNNEEFDINMTRRIHPNINCSQFSILQMILLLFMRHNLTGVALEDILTMINTIFGFKCLPTSKYLFFKMFTKYYNPKYNFFCKLCLTPSNLNPNIGDENIKDFRCSKCKHINIFDRTSDSNYFITFPLEQQLRETIINNSDDFINDKKEIGENLNDISSGTIYKSLPNLERRKITLTLNTDGVQIFKSKSKSLWPVQVIINELNSNVRFQTKNILCVALWFHIKHPSMKMILKPLIEELNNLKRNGLTMKINNITYVFDITVICATLDAPAKASVQNLINHNGYHSCHYCEARGTKYGKTHVRYPYNIKLKMRTHKKAVKQMKKASKIKKNVVGFKGISAMIALPSFNVIDCFAIDYMHSVLLGIVRRLLKLWFDPQKQRKEYNLRKHVEKVNEKILKIKLPSEIQRKPRIITERNTWKANEFRCWLLFYSIGILNNILPQKYLDHYIHLIKCIEIYLKPTINKNDLQIARNQMKIFLQKFEELYGLQNMVYNLHTLQHLADCVDHLGPLWAYSNFPFENNNGKLARYVNSPKSVLNQIWTKYSLSRKLQVMRLEEPALQFEKNMTKKSHLISSSNICKVLGKPTKEKFDLSKYEHNGFLSDLFFKYNRISKNNIIYSTKSYCKNKMSDDSFLKFAGDRYGCINEIIVQEDDIYLAIDELNIIENENMIVYEVSNKRPIIIPETAIVNKCVCVNTEELKYLVNFSLFCDKD